MTDTTPQPPYSRSVLIGGIVALCLFGTAAVLFVQGGDSLQRLALLFGMIGAAVTAFLAMLKADLSATQTNGGLDARIQAGVHRALAARRQGDPPLTPDEIAELTKP